MQGPIVWRRIVASVLATLALGAARPHAYAQPGPDATAPRGEAGTPAERARRAAIVARVGDHALTVGEIEDMLNEAPVPVRRAYNDPARRRAFVDNVVSTLLLADEARRRGLERTPEVAGAVRRILAQRLQQAEILAAITMADVSDADVRAHYAAHLSEYQQPELRRATVLVTTDRAGAEQAARDLRALRGDMRRVQALVRERSVDPTTRNRDGDLFYFPRSGGTRPGEPAVDPAVAAAAFALPRETEVSPPVRTADGRFAVVVLTGMRPALSRAVTDPGVANSVRGYLVRERRRERERTLIEQLRARARAETHPELLDLIHLPPADLGNVPAFAPAAAPPPPAPRG